MSIVKNLSFAAFLCLAIVSCDMMNATLEIKSNVKGAEVIVNNKSFGIAPQTVSVASGETVIVVKKKGYSDFKTTLALESRSEQTVNASLRSLASVILEVNSNIDESEVYLNNKLIGKTPLKKKMRPGKGNISVRANGYQSYEESISAGANSTKTIDAILVTDLEAIRDRDEAAFRTDDSGTFTDTRDGKQYSWLKINDKIWMTENLKFRVNARSWCYDKDPDNCDQYGRLYSQRGAKEAAKLDGWRVPTDQEWSDLVETNNGSGEAYNSLINGGTLGFNAELGGIYNYFSQFADAKEVGYYWSSTKDNSCDICAFSWVFDSKTETIYRNTESFIPMGFSVRLVRNVSDL